MDIRRRPVRARTLTLKIVRTTLIDEASRYASERSLQAVERRMVVEALARRNKLTRIQ